MKPLLRPDMSAGATMPVIDRGLLAILTVAAALRLAVVLGVDLAQTSDFLWYLNRARSIAAGEGYVVEGVLTAFWPVGYPAFLAGLFTLFGPHELVAKLGNLACALLLIAWVHRFALDLGAGRVGANLAALLLALYPNQIAYTALLSSEILYALSLVAAIHLLFRCARDGSWLLALASGALFGTAVMIKPQTVLVPVLAAPLMPWSGAWAGRLGRLGVAAVAAAIVLAPWQLRNHQLFGTFVFVSTNGGANLLIGNSPHADGGWMPLQLSVGTRLCTEAPEVELVCDRGAREAAVRWIQENPAEFMRLIPAKLNGLLAIDGEAEWAFTAGQPDLTPEEVAAYRAIRWGNQAYYLAIWLGAAGALVLALVLRRRPARTFWVGWAVVAVFTALGAVFFGHPRFHFPMMPFLALYCGQLVPLLRSLPRTHGGTGARAQPAVA